MSEILEPMSTKLFSACTRSSQAAGSRRGLTAVLLGSTFGFLVLLLIGMTMGVVSKQTAVYGFCAISIVAGSIVATSRR